MLKNNKIAIGIIVALLAFQVLFEIYKPKPIEWKSDYTQYSKKPYSTYILRRQLPDLFPKQPIQDVKTPIYNCLDDKLDTYFEEEEETNLSDSLQYNYIFANQQVDFDSLDLNRLLSAVDIGYNVFIAAESLGALADTLKLNTDANFDYIYDNDTSKEKVTLQLLNKALSNKTYSYKKDQAAYYFIPDSVRNAYEVLGVNQKKQPVFIKIPFGEGNFWLHSVPIALSNYSLTKNDNAQYASAVLSYLPANRPILWDEYYKAGKSINESTFRYVLSVEPLKWALYVALVGLLLFMLFEAKRKQRIIPIIKPLENTTLEFAQTVGMLYYQTANHKDIAEKKITYLFDYIRKRFFVTNIAYNNVFYEQLAQKSNLSTEQIQQLFGQIVAIKTQNKNNISQEQLLQLNEQIDNFYRNTK